MKEILKSVYSKILLFALIAFLAGFFWGWAWGTYYAKKRIHKILGLRSEERHEFIVKKLDRELNFTPEQFEVVNRIVHKNLKQMEEVRGKCLPQEDEIFKKGLEEIESTLTTEQKERWAKIKNRLIKDREKFKKFRYLHGSPHHPPSHFSSEE